MKKLLVTMLTVTLLLALVAQPAFASQPTTEAPAITALYASGGVTKIASYWYGYKVYLSNSLCLKMGAILSTGGVGALALWVASTGLFAAPIWAVLIGVGTALVTANGMSKRGVVVTIYRIPWPGFPYGLLIPGPISSQ